MSTGLALGKPLAGIVSLLPSITAQVSSDVLGTVSVGGQTLSNVNITSGIIDGVTIGSNVAGPIFATTITSGNAQGLGYNVIFYGNITGDYVQWNPNLNQFNIQGDLLVRDLADLGNLRVNINTISATNTNGNINLAPNGSGSVNIFSPINQTTLQGDISFNSSSGSFNSSVSNDINLISTSGNLIATTQQSQLFTTNENSITFNTGINKVLRYITFISLGSTPTITTSSSHNLDIGDIIIFSATNCIPSLNNKRIQVSTILSSTQFTITLISPITSSGNTGSFFLSSDIYLTPSIDGYSGIFIPYNIHLNFGDTPNYIYADNAINNNLFITASGHIELTPGNSKSILIPSNNPITLGTNSTIIDNGSDLNISSSNKINLNSNVTINGDFTVNGTQTDLETIQLMAMDPIITIGGNNLPTSDDNKWRGIAFYWYSSSTPKIGFFGRDHSDDYFTYIPNATITNEVVSGSLGNAKFANISASQLSVSSTLSVTNSITTGQLNCCIINCSGILNLIGGIAIYLDTNSIYTRQSSKLAFDVLSNNYIQEDINSNLIINSIENLHLVTNNILIPISSKIILNNSTLSPNYINSTSTNILLNSIGIINFTAVTNYQFSQNVPIYLNSTGTTSVYSDNNSNLIINSANYINLIPLNNINIPLNKHLEFGNVNSYIYGDINNDINIISYNINLIPTSSVIIPQNKHLQIGASSEYIYSDTFNNLFINTYANISLSSSSQLINLLSNTFLSQSKQLFFGASTEFITSDSLHNLTLSGSNTLNVVLTNGINITSSNSNITLSPFSNVIIPQTKHLQLGVSTEFITSNISNDILINANGSIIINTNFIIPLLKKLQFGNTTEYITTDSSSNLFINGNNTLSTTFNSISLISNNNINLTPTLSVIIPQTKKLQLGGSSEHIYSDTSNNILINANGNILTNTNIILDSNKKLQLGATSEYISGNSGTLTIAANILTNIISPVTISGNTIINGTSTIINSTNVSINDPIITIGQSINDLKDRGLEIKQATNLSSFNCFIGIKQNTQYFTYLTNTTNLNEVISGTLGNVQFGSGSFTGLNLNNGTISNLSSILSSGSLTLTNTTLNLNSSNSIIIPSNIPLQFHNDNTQIYSDGVDLHIVGIAPSRVYLNADTIVQGNLTIQGNINLANSTTTVNYTEEYLSSNGASINPSGSTNITWISITASMVNVSGTLSSGSSSGFVKKVYILQMANNSVFTLTINNIVSPYDGIISSRTITFSSAGQGISLLWSNTQNNYIIESINGIIT